MKVYSGERYFEDIATEWFKSLPLSLLEFISMNSNSSRGMISRYFKKRIPINEEVLLTNIKLSLDFLEQRGDVITGNHSTIRVYPPYVIVEDKNIVSGLPLFGGIIEEETAHYRVEIQMDTRGTGYNRIILFKTNDDPANVLKLYGISIVNLDNIFCGKINIDKLEAKSVDRSLHWPGLLKNWFIYKANLTKNYQALKWEKLDDNTWDDNFVLMRAEDSNEYDSSYRRYFLHLGAKKLIEIDLNNSYWWQYKLDKENNTAMKYEYKYKDQCLKINGFFPKEIHQCLNIMSFKPSERQSFTTFYYLSKYHINSVKQMLEKALGVYILLR